MYQALLGVVLCIRLQSLDRQDFGRVCYKLTPVLSAQVRAHAVEVLKRTEDEELLYYLLQLVQALRYEEADDSPLAQFLVQRAVANPTLAFTLHW